MEMKKLSQWTDNKIITVYKNYWTGKLGWGILWEEEKYKLIYFRNWENKFWSSNIPLIFQKKKIEERGEFLKKC